MNSLIGPKMFSIFMCMITFCVTTSSAQKYEMIETGNMQVRNEFLARYDTKGDDFISEIKSKYDGKMRKRMIEQLMEYNQFYRDEITEDALVFDKNFEGKLETIVNEIKDKNPWIRSDFLIGLSHDPGLNAFCHPNGLLIVNMGLFYYLENEDQLAAIVSHEIGHNLLKHGERATQARIEKQLSKNYKAQIHSIRGKRHNRKKFALQMIQDELYDSGRRRRDNEIQADSIGFELFQNTKYAASEFTEALELTARYDTFKPAGLMGTTYQTYFDLPDQPFKAEWLAQLDFSDYHYKEIEEQFHKDSLSSHPETNERLDCLKKYFGEKVWQSTPVDTQYKEHFNQLGRIAQYEQIPALVNQEEYGVAIYTCLFRLQDEVDPVYYKYWLGALFGHIRNARKSYTLNRYVDRVDIENQSESYQQFLNFIWNLELDEIESISSYYSE